MFHRRGYEGKHREDDRISGKHGSKVTKVRATDPNHKPQHDLETKIRENIIESGGMLD
jgi:hypothetical protein